jgi:sporulation protein YlmC with PRC-barrel domain
MTTVNVQDLIGRTAIDSAGEKVGKIEQVYLDNETGQPNWVAVSSGLMGRRSNFAPMHNAQLSGEDVQLGVTKQMVDDAPVIEDDGHLDKYQEGTLYEYYSGYTGDKYTTSDEASDAEAP